MWRESALFQDLRRPQTGVAGLQCSHFDACRGGCMAAKVFTGLPLDGPDPECVLGHGESLLDRLDDPDIPPSRVDHSIRPARRPAPACDTSPLAGFELPVVEVRR